jgi:hypothetical protein
MMRCEEPGWVRIGGQGRRSLWFRYEDGAAYFELCAGREGDDAYARIATGLDAPLGIRIGHRGFGDLLQVLQTAAFAMVEGAPCKT